MLSEILNIDKGITAIIGSGGKTTLMLSLARELTAKGRVIICTTTHIKPPDDIITLISPNEEAIIKAFEKEKLICIGNMAENNKLTASAIAFRKLKQMADYVIVEADGSKQLPMKAHAEYEPVIPSDAVKTILIVGIKGIGNKISRICHRPQLFAELTATDINTIVTPDIVAKAIIREDLGDIIVINQVENEEDMLNARLMANLINKPVYAGEIERGILICL